MGLEPKHDGGVIVEFAEVEQLRHQGSDALAVYFESARVRLHKMVMLRLDPRLHARVDADDILQDSFVDASARLHEYLQNPDVPLIVWLRFLVGQRITATHRWHLRQKRSAFRECDAEPLRPAIQRTSLLDQIAGSDTSPSLVLSRKELHGSLYGLLASLDPTDREVLCLRHLEELSNLEAAAELAISPAAASKRYVRALARLRGSARDCDLEL